MTTENGHSTEPCTDANDGGGATDVISDLEKNIIRQVEYYFGDYNLTKDKFLQEAVKADDGWVLLEKLVTFNRLKQLTTDFKTIVTALRKSSAKLIEVAEDETKIRRSLEKPLPENDEKRREDINIRSVYVKGFPQDTTLDQLLDFFKKDNAVEHLQRRFFENTFKGSVFVVFKTLDEVNAFLKKEGVKYGDTELLKESKSAYITRKQEERKQKKEERVKSKEKRKISQEDTSKPIVFEPGRVVHINGLGEKASVQGLKTVFNEHAPVAWVDFNKGDVEAWVRFKENAAAEVIEKLKEANDGKFLIEGVEVTHKILEGEEELEFYKNTAKAKEEQLQRKQRSSRGRGRSHYGRGGGGRWRNHKGDNQGGKNNDIEEPKKRPAEEPAEGRSAKVVKTEESAENLSAKVMKTEESAGSPSAKVIKTEESTESPSAKVMKTEESTD